MFWPLTSSWSPVHISTVLADEKSKKNDEITRKIGFCINYKKIPENG
jgi:hypothetical protein